MTTLTDDEVLNLGRSILSKTSNEYTYVHLKSEKGSFIESFMFTFYKDQWNLHVRGLLIKNVNEKDPFSEKESVWTEYVD